MRMRNLGLIGLSLLVAALTVGACSSGDETKASSRSEPGADVASTTTTAPITSDSTAICAIFGQLAANGGGRDAQFTVSTPAGWERRIELTGEIVNAAPPEWRDEAETYLQMVKDRAQLAADNGYVAVNDLPAEVRTAFITSHRAMQSEVDDLIAYMNAECGGRTTG